MPRKPLDPIYVHIIVPCAIGQNTLIKQCPGATHDKLGMLLVQAKFGRRLSVPSIEVISVTTTQREKEEMNSHS